MEIGSRTQAFINKCIELKGIETEAKAAYERAVEASNVNAALVNTLEARMLTESPTAEMLNDWRTARARMDVLDAERSGVHTRLRNVRGDISQKLGDCFVTFRMEHIDVGDPENQEWPTL